MSWDAIGAIAEAIGALAVVVSIVYKVFENIYLHFLEGSIAEEAWKNNNEILFLYYAQNGAQE